MDKLFVHACQIIKEVHQDADLNVLLVLNAPKIAHVAAKNAQTPVLEHVVKMRSAVL